MNILQIMGCTSDQYASLEYYLVEKASICKKLGYNFIVAYNNVPKSEKFIHDLTNNGALLLKLEASSLLDIKFYKKYFKILKENKIDVVHAYFAPTRHFAIIGAWLFGIKKRFRQAANLPLSQQTKNGLKYRLFLIRHKILTFFITKYICRSNAVKNEYVEMGISPAKLKVADGGTDIIKYKKHNIINRKDLLGIEINNNTLIVGTASRLVKEKGLLTFLNAIKKIKEQGYNIISIILGDGPEKNKLEKFVAENSLEDYVNLLGHRENLELYYNTFDLYVSTSYSEGMSNSILEAMACELPVLLSDIEPNKEIIDIAKKQGYYIGEYFSTGSAEELTKKIISFHNLKKKEEIGKSSRKVIVNNYSIKQRIDKELKIYKGLL